MGIKFRSRESCSGTEGVSQVLDCKVEGELSGVVLKGSAKDPLGEFVFTWVESIFVYIGTRELDVTSSPGNSPMGIPKTFAKVNNIKPRIIQMDMDRLFKAWLSRLKNPQMDSQ